MAQPVSVRVLLKESGGIPLSPWSPLALIKGQHAKLGVLFLDSNGLALVWTAFTAKLRIPLGDGSVAVKTVVPVNNNRGEGEVVLAPSDTLLLGTGSGHKLEIELYLTASPTTTSFYPVQDTIAVTVQQYTVV